MKRRGSLGKKFEKLVEILAHLRSAKGCPWDREQDEQSIRHYFLEEVYEAIEAMDRGDASQVAEELGDVLMEVVFIAQIYKEKGKFTLEDCLDQILAKLVRRHPHVFGLKKANSVPQVAALWHEQKNAERKGKTLFDGIASSAPSLLTAFQIGQRAAAYGFDWSGVAEVLAKVKEEMAELERAFRQGNRPHVREELGDVFFALANLSRLLKLNPELVLRRSNQKFKNRFLALEARLKRKGMSLSQATPEEMETVWREVKKKRPAGNEPRFA